MENFNIFLENFNSFSNNILNINSISLISLLNKIPNNFDIDINKTKKIIDNINNKLDLKYNKEENYKTILLYKNQKFFFKYYKDTDNIEKKFYLDSMKFIYILKDSIFKNKKDYNIIKNIFLKNIIPIFHNNNSIININIDDDFNKIKKYNYTNIVIEKYKLLTTNKTNDVDLLISSDDLFIIYNFLKDIIEPYLFISIMLFEKNIINFKTYVNIIILIKDKLEKFLFLFKNLNNETFNYNLKILSFQFLISNNIYKNNKEMFKKEQQDILNDLYNEDLINKIINKFTSFKYTF